MTFFNDEQNEYFSEDFCKLELSGAKTESVSFEKCTFKNCDFSGAVFIDCEFIECHFIQCNLSVAKLGFSKFNDVIFEDCKAIGIDWTRAAWPEIGLFSPIRFSGCIINDSIFFGLNLKNLVIEKCKAKDVDFRDGSFRSANFTSTDFSNSLFRGTDLKDADFTEAVNYQIDINNNRINGAKFSRYEALSLLECLEIELVD